MLAASSCIVAAGGDPKSQLVGGEWVVEDVNGGGVIDDARASLMFGEDGRVSGSATCNRYGAAYSVKGDRLKISDAAATLAACADALNEQERRFFAVIERDLTWRIDETGALILESSDGGSIRARR
jgi:putative lipoprotein